MWVIAASISSYTCMEASKKIYISMIWAEFFNGGPAERVILGVGFITICFILNKFLAE